MSKQVWESKRIGDSWFSLSDDGSLMFNRSLPPAPPAPGGSGKRMTRTEGVGDLLNDQELASLAAAAATLASEAPRRRQMVVNRAASE